MSVPVLSKITSSVFASDSTNVAPLTSTPTLANEPMPAKYVSGTEITSAHGHETTKKQSARYAKLAKFL